MARFALFSLIALGLAAAAARPLLADSTAGDTLAAPTDTGQSYKERFINSLPPAIGDGLDIDTWGWLGLLQTNFENYRYYDAELGLGITKSFDQRVAVGAQVNFIDANGKTRWELEQGYLSTKLSDQTQTIFTVGKFNANIGIEGRDFWSRNTATTSLLFSAKPQDLLGVMITQPIGDTGLTLRPFLSEGFESAYDFNQSPSAGITAQYKPNRSLEFAVTNWVGPGMLLYGGRYMHLPFERAYGSDSDPDPAGAVVENWEGPNFYAERGGTLYFVDASAIFHINSDWTVAAEGLFGNTSTRDDQWAWGGFMLLTTYSVTDQLHVYGRWSYLDDSDWLVTGVFQRCQELSVGAGYQFVDGLELRGEYRHDFSNATADFDTVSMHLTFTY